MRVGREESNRPFTSKRGRSIAATDQKDGPDPLTHRSVTVTDDPLALAERQIRPRRDVPVPAPASAPPPPQWYEHDERNNSSNYGAIER